MNNAISYTEPIAQRALAHNNFDLLRFIFAFIVLLVHASTLSHYSELLVLNKFLSSEIAVKSFFVISGFLIFMSYENSRNTRKYFEKRFRRIYPAYFTVVITCAILGVLLSAESWSTLFVPWLKYIVTNLLFLNFLQPSLPGLFESNPFQAVNGALWTLKIEVMFYLSVPLIIFLFKKLGRLNTLITGFILSCVYSMVTLELAARTPLFIELQRQLPGQLSFFIAGAACYYYLDYFSRNKVWLLGLTILTLFFKAWLPTLIIEPLTLSIIVIYIACFLPWHINFGKYGDFSYGIYIIHFPILQTLIAFKIFSTLPWIFLLSATVLILLLSCILWRFVEKPFLRRSSHYIANR